MILFQIDQFCLRKEIKSFSWSIKEEQSKFSVNSSYIEGDHRIRRNKTNKVVLSCTGLVESQHFIHYLRALSNQDNGEAKIKCFFIEKYTKINPFYEPISSVTEATNTPYSYRVFFNYCHIDIVAVNPINNCDILTYEVQFDVSLWHVNNFDITTEANAFIVDRNKYGQLDIRYDEQYLYDDIHRYDQFIASLSSDSQSLLASSKNLTKLYESVSCCDPNNYFYLLFVDRIIKPFVMDNLYPSAGKINYSIDNKKFNGEQNNFLQFWISNPRNILENPVPKTYTNQTYFVKDKWNPDNLAGDDPYTIGNLNLVSNTYTTNAVIQIFRAWYENVGSPNYYQPQSGLSIPSLFHDLNQSITIEVANQSTLTITCKTDFLKDNLKMLVIHPHTQKVFGYFGNVYPSWNKYDFDFTSNQNMSDLETYILKGELTVTTNKIGSNDWFSLSPRYQPNVINKSANNTITFSTSGTPDVQNPTALCLQIITYAENSLI